MSRIWQKVTHPNTPHDIMEEQEHHVNGGVGGGGSGSGGRESRDGDE